MSYSNGPKMVTDGLVLCLDSGNRKSYNSGSGTWFDLSGNNNASLFNTPTFSSENFGTLIFDGVDDYALIPSFSYNFNGPFTLSVSFYQTSNTVSQTLFSNYNGTSNDGLFTQINSAAEGSGFRITYRQLGTNILNFTQTAPVSLNQFYNIVCTYDGANAYTYYNTIRQSVSASATTYFAPVNTASFINTITGVDRYFAGKFYDTKIYSRALTQTEITQNYNATKGRFGL